MARFQEPQGQRAWSEPIWRRSRRSTSRRYPPPAAW
jgi:hypothetical protein